jgi:hypothetical protein
MIVFERRLPKTKRTLMRPNIRSISALVMIFVLVFSFGCENAPLLKGNYRKQYCGNFSFTMIVFNWRMDTGAWYDTVYTEGLVRIYEPDDSESDLYVSDDSDLDKHKRITIAMKDRNPFITPIIDEAGFFSPLSGYHYYHEGLFTDPDHFNFSVIGLGGMGGGCNYYVQGVRKSQ